MKDGMVLTKGLYFKNGLELERALMILSEHGFELEESVCVAHDFEVALALENKKLASRLTGMSWV